MFANLAIPWIIYIAHEGPNKMLDCNTSFERSLSKLSGNHKNVDIGSTILKLWQPKDVQLHSIHSMVRGFFWLP